MDLLRLFQRNLNWSAVLWLKWGWEDRWVSGGREGGRETHYHTALQTSHTSPPPPHISLHFSQWSNINLNFSSKLWSVCMSSTVVWFKGAPVVLWKQRGLLLFQQMLVRLKCADCSAVFLMLNLCSGKHLITHTSTVCCCISQPCHQWFYCCCLFDSLHKRNDDRFKYFFHIDVYNKGLKAHLKEKKVPFKYMHLMILYFKWFYNNIIQYFLLYFTCVKLQSSFLLI